MTIAPCVPVDWPGFRVDYRLPDGVTQCRIEIENPDGGPRSMLADLDGSSLAIERGAVRAVLPSGLGEHRIRVRLGEPSPV